MRQITMIGIVGAAAILASGCGGSTGTLSNRPRTPEPITITGSISNSRVLISPSTFGAGPVNFEVTNAATQSVSLAVRNASGQSVADLASINPDTPGVVKFNIPPGDYAVIASPPGIKAAELHVGRERPRAGNGLLEPQA